MILLADLSVKFFKSMKYPDFMYDITRRPKGAKNCGCYIDLNNINKLSISHGMPSGHTQNIFFLTTFLTLYFKSTFKTLLLGIIAFYGGYLRIKFGCHTIKQVIMGGLFGILLASISYFLLKKNLVI